MKKKNFLLILFSIIICFLIVSCSGSGTIITRTLHYNEKGEIFQTDSLKIDYQGKRPKIETYKLTKEHDANGNLIKYDSAITTIIK